MKLQRIEDFEVWAKVQAFWIAVNAILSRQAFCKEFDLRKQIRDALDSIPSNMSEGFEQPTDRAFANYLFTSKASTAEVCTRLGQAAGRACVTDAEVAAFGTQGDEIRRMLTGLIKHLMKTPSRRRGLGDKTNGQPPAKNQD